MVRKEATFLGWVFAGRTGPLDATFFVELLVAVNAGDVAGLTFGEFLEDFEGSGWAGPFFEHLTAAPSVGEELEDAEIREGLAGCVTNLLKGADATFGIDEGTGLFAPRGGREEEVGGLGRLGGGIHVLDHEEV